MKPIVVIDQARCQERDVSGFRAMLEAEGYFVVFASDGAVTMLDPNQYNVTETTEYVTVAATKPGTPCS